MTWWQYALLVLLVPISVELSIRMRWREIKSMFDRALMHGGSIDTLATALRDANAKSETKAEQALQLATKTSEALPLVHDRLRALENHPLLRPLGGHGPPKAP